MLAVLEDAVGCYQKYMDVKSLRESRLFEDACTWIESHDHAYLFSFENVCDTLGFNPEYIRRGIRQWTGEWRQREADDPSRPRLVGGD